MIPPAHPIWTAREWDNSLLNDLPDTQLRWFAADCAERACIADGNVSEESIRAIITARLHAMGMVSQQELAKARRAADSAAGRAALWAAGRAANSAADWAADWAAYRAADRAAHRAAERSWQLARLQYLVSVWGICGERSPGLLWDHACPIDCPEEARL